MTWQCFKHHIKKEYQKITNLLGTTFDEVPRFITEKWVEVHDQSGSADDRYKPSKQIRFKTSMLRSDLCDFNDAYIVVKWTITVTEIPACPELDVKSKIGKLFMNKKVLEECSVKIYEFDSFFYEHHTKKKLTKMAGNTYYLEMMSILLKIFWP